MSVGVQERGAACVRVKQVPSGSAPDRRVARIHVARHHRGGGGCGAVFRIGAVRRVRRQVGRGAVESRCRRRRHDDRSNALEQVSVARNNTRQHAPGQISGRVHAPFLVDVARPRPSRGPPRLGRGAPFLELLKQEADDLKALRRDLAHRYLTTLQRALKEGDALAYEEVVAIVREVLGPVAPEAHEKNDDGALDVEELEAGLDERPE
mgnify:CR=1 FL=1